ncbi:MAG: Hsp20/alpha crystallin family protein [Aminobacterium sp.]|jgi:HSP20 family protein|uniref:Hsp20/alpha crystallin family protein n=1 Tax=unclassified Aminobacterium TaxID=2685012 RepID=UPI001BCD3C1E|nr:MULTISPECIES: Hsp20/alpha crystallin family protein [unclassified Aminobacterium]MDD2207209.1 Hsp20/alpha crystallin family protein [Aminobacterium sp.]MDD3426793.1 Hsp20/alpha crystallin family protein [Aminobacterium sp.]MDD3707201.1 Hsp20/alpha crystallin family protein [Aminobacterium sp.]MDD4229051.1 Hsp20/alpha crystallin family protein [Aminobacterium sp.]MDD4551957.1 Hsp20/alpha crystallin family protein [Aminobacterium sp.]
MKRYLARRPLDRVFPSTFFSSPMENMMKNMFRSFDDVMSSFPWNEESASTSMTPRGDMYRKDGKIIAELELPGVDPAQVDLKIYHDRLVLNVVKKDERQIEDENYYRAERYYGNISRILQFPEEVDPESAKASYKNGILTIEITEKKQPEKYKSIEIKNEETN